MKISFAIIGCLTLLPVAVTSAGDPFGIDSWRMTNGVMTPNDLDVRRATVVQNPLRQTYEASIDRTRAIMDLDFSWDCQAADFLVDVSHETEDTAAGSNECSTSGQIVFTPRGVRGLQLTFEGEYTYWAPSPGFLIRLSMVVTKMGSGALFGDTHQSGPAGLGPPSGTLHDSTSLFLEADGSTYRINFEMLSDTYRGGTSIIATGDGHVTIHLEAVGFPPGDANCDGCVDGADIDGFVLGFTDPAAYAEQYDACDLDNLDLNGDRALTLTDVAALVGLLLRG